MEQNVSVTPADTWSQLRSAAVWESGEFPKEDFRKRLMRSGGPGGQNVNNVSTKVEIRFDLRRASWLKTEMRELLLRKERSRINKLGEFTISSDKTRHAEANEADCYEKLRAILTACAQEIELRDRPPSDEDLRILNERAALAEQRRRQVVFKCTDTPKAELEIRNSWNRAVIFKLKSTRPNVLKMRPVFGSIPPSDSKKIALTIRSEQPSTINWNTSDRFVVVIAPSPPNCTNIPRAWKSHCPEVDHQAIRKVVKIRVLTTSDENKKDGVDLAKTNIVVSEVGSGKTPPAITPSSTTKQDSSSSSTSTDTEVSSKKMPAK